MTVRAQNPPATPPTPPCPPHDTNGSPHYPETDEEFRDRRNALEGYRDGNASNQRGTRFEGAAARHNANDVIRQEAELNRDSPTRRSAVSGPSDSEKVRFTCSRCGAVQENAGEVDHVIRKRDGSADVVECKDADAFNPAESPQQTTRNIRQMERLGGMAQAQGMGITYKIPSNHHQAAQQIQNTAERLEINVTVVPI